MKIPWTERPISCGRPASTAPSNDLREAPLFVFDFLGGSGETGECQIIQRRVIWLCDACSGKLTVETWRPLLRTVRPSRRPRMDFPHARGSTPQAESWS